MNSRWSARTCSACKVALSRMRSVTLRPVVSVDRRSMLLDIRPDFPDGSEPNAVGRVIGIVAQCLQRFGVGHLITSLTDLVAHKNQPAPLLRRFLDRFDHLFKAHVVKRRAQCLREIAERGIVRGFVEITAADQKTLRNQGYVAFRVPSPSNKLLSARVGKSFWLYSQQTANLCIRRVELFLYHRERVILKSVVAAKLIVSGARMCQGVIADLMSVGYSLAPALQALFDPVPWKEKRNPYTAVTEQRQTCVDLTETSVVKA